MRTPEEGALFDAEHVEKVEQQFDSYIEKRAREARDQERIDELWADAPRARGAGRGGHENPKNQSTSQLSAAAASGSEQRGGEMNLRGRLGRLERLEGRAGGGSLS